MPRYELRDNIKVQFSPEREAEYDARKIADEASFPQRQWERDMSKARQSMSDELEDLWDAIGVANATQSVKDSYNAKKDVRARKP